MRALTLVAVALVLLGSVWGARSIQPTQVRTAVTVGLPAVGEPVGEPAGDRPSGDEPTGDEPTGDEPSRDEPTPPGSDSDWWTVLGQLDERRSAVLMAGDPQGLADYAMPGSAAWQADEAMLGNLAASGVRPVGLQSRLLAIERVSAVQEGVELQVVDLRSGYDLVDAVTGSVSGSVEAAAASRWTVILSPAVDPKEQDPGWRVVSVVPGADRSGP